MVAGTVAPLEECLVLCWRGAMTTNVAVGGHVNDFRVGWRALDPAMFVTAAEDVCLEFHVCSLSVQKSGEQSRTRWRWDSECPCECGRLTFVNNSEWTAAGDAVACLLPVRPTFKKSWFFIGFLVS